ncbi:MAG: DNA polymerase III subunit gamma/tau [Oscillibacter sp.]|nr:DNA polymerase III subunit gamma/tau [Oscillibacter sp.]
MYQALYRKWRPRVFADVVGQEHVTQTLRRQVAEGRTSHAYLFTGTRGTGKTTCAKILSRAVNCENPKDGDPCGECPACVGLESGRILDVLELDAASNNGVDQVRALRDEAVYAPASVRTRVYIVDEVHMLSTPAFNALLKILEEPPEHLMFILATTELHKVPATILSRCQRYAFKRILPRDIQGRLTYVAQQEGMDLSEDGAALLSRLADGALRDALSLLDQCAASGGRIDSAAVLDTLGLAGQLQTIELCGHILRRDAGAALDLFGKLYEGGKDPATVLGELSGLVRDLMLRQIAPGGGAALRTSDDAALRDLPRDIPPARLLYMSSTLQRDTAALYNSSSRRTDAELCLLRLCDETLSAGVEALAARVERLEELLSQGFASVTPETASAASAAVSVRPAAKPGNQTASRPAPARTPPPVSMQAPPPVPEVPLWDGPDAPPIQDDVPPWDGPDAPPVPDAASPWDERDVPPSGDDVPPDTPPWGEPDTQPENAAPETETSASSAPDSPAASASPAAAGPTDAAWWDSLLSHALGRLPPMYRAFMKNCFGVLDGGILTLYGPDDTTLGRLDNDRVRGVLTELSGAVRIAFREGEPPKASPEENLRQLLAFSRQYDNIVVKGGQE